MEMKDDKTSSLALEYIGKALNNPTVPELPEALRECEQFTAIFTRLMEMRTVVAGFAKGDLSHDIRMRGFIAGGLKNLQAHLRHMTWTTQQVELGDLNQKMVFLGDFSDAFNSMVAQLARSRQELTEKHEELEALNAGLVEEVDRRVAAYIALKESEAKFRYLAEHDPLTGVLNRRSFYAMLEAELAKASKAGGICCIAMLDIDRFKNFNDLYGHVEGDRALKHVVTIVQGQLRQTDFLGRFGGEEFILFFGSADADQGMIAAERIRRAIERTPVLLSDGTEISLTASIGLTAVHPEWFDENKTIAQIEQYVHSADIGLYNAKTGGRNLTEMTPAVKPV